MKVRKSRFYATIFAIVAYFISGFLLKRYTKGDQEHYREFYNQCFYDGSVVWQEFFCYQITLGSTEPVYFYIVKIFHGLIAKDTLIAIANSILVFLITILIFKYYKNTITRIIFLFLVFTNFYLIVLLLAAERLKFSFIFLIVALFFFNIKKIVFFAIAMLTHVQIALMIAPIYVSKILEDDMKLWKKVIVASLALLASGGVFYVMQEHIISKFDAYKLDDDSSTGIIGAIKTSIFIILAVISTRKFLILLSGLPIVALSYFLGADRIGMLAFILYAASVIYYKGRMDLPLFIVMLYFSYKSFGFILNVLNYGNGYGGY